MPEPRTPQTIAAHMHTILAPTTATACHWYERAGHPIGHLARTITGAAITLDGINLYDIAGSLSEQRRQAEQGRPRGGSGNGGGSSPSVSSTTADTAMELYRIRSYGMDLQEAIDRLHPDPVWPTIASGWRARNSTATENLAHELDLTWTGDSSAGNLTDAVEGIAVAVKLVVMRANRAGKVRAWHGDPADIDPPDDLTEAARCSTPDCGHWRADHRDANGSTHDTDKCIECVAKLCPMCWTRPRRSPNAKDCMACQIRNRRRAA